jgi:hypothetical protein
MVSALIPHAAKQPQNCEETFALSHQLFKKRADISVDSLNLDELVEQWSALLISHTPNEVCGHFQGSRLCINNTPEHWPP